MAQLSPMMQQYLNTKEQYKDCILFYRLGDFYEMFFDDALTASKELEITLTSKNCGLDEKAPMCGVPFHAVENYLARLVSKGYKVAICEQVEDPKTVKGIVKREVVRIVTPGTITSSSALDEKKNNYIISIIEVDDMFGIAICDVTTGYFSVTQTDSLKKTLDEVLKYMPSEIVCNDAFLISGIDINDLKYRLGITIYPLKPHYFDEDLCIDSLKKHFNVDNLKGLGLNDYQFAIISAGGLIKYLHDTQMTSLAHISNIKPYSTDKFMVLDSSTRRNLELSETLREKNKRGSLLGILDKTKTAMGARLLRNYIEQPLIEQEEIIKRLNAVETLNKDLINREEIREYLNSIYDLERLISRISYKTANPRDLIAFKNSLAMIPHIKNIVREYDDELLSEIFNSLDDLKDLHDLINKSIVEEPPISVREGGFIKEGFNEEIDKYKHSKTEGKSWLLELEAKEREKTGIKNLKIKYNKVFGYYLEVTNSYKDLVPDNYTRKQTLSNAERYICPELKELEDIILGAEDKLCNLEYDFFCKIRDEIAKNMLRVQKTANALAMLDVFASFAYVAERNDYCKPEITDNGIIDIKKGRHPVVETMISNGMFIENDTYLDSSQKRISIITGPNMAGKSTYMRQTALIVLMAQIGCFVPAKSASISVVDRIFTRVGASDDLASGQSTFMVEMTEVANILRNASNKSLVVLDEIGRGTSTYDGLSIAWAVVEHIADNKKIGAKTLFATHYHELTQLEEKIDCVNNYSIAVKEQGDDIVFLRKIIEGGADRSYGIQVAKLAGVPNEVIERAKVILDDLVSTKVQQNEEYSQLSLFDFTLPANDKPNDENSQIINEIKELNINNITPMEAMNFLCELQAKIK